VPRSCRRKDVQRTITTARCRDGNYPRRIPCAARVDTDVRSRPTQKDMRYIVSGGKHSGVLLGTHFQFDRRENTEGHIELNVKSSWVMEQAGTRRVSRIRIVVRPQEHAFDKGAPDRGCNGTKKGHGGWKASGPGRPPMPSTLSRQRAPKKAPLPAADRQSTPTRIGAGE